MTLDYLIQSFEFWSGPIDVGLQKLRERGELAPTSAPHDLVVAILSAIQSGLLSSKTLHSAPRLELALAMAQEHVAEI